MTRKASRPISLDAGGGDPPTPTIPACLRVWSGFLAGREPSQELADEFVAQLAAKHTEVTTRAFRSTVNSFLRASAAESGVPIVVRLNAAGGQRRGRRRASFRAE
jgi:hypothetical protein